MSSTPLLSVGLFVYNGERFIEKALDSILGQTFSDFELIISDNASTDRTGEICRNYAQRDSRIRYYRNEKNMGAGWNVQRVYHLATGKYFKWAASDDFCEPNFLQLCVEALEQHPEAVLAHSRVRVVDQDGNHVEFYDECPMRVESEDPLIRLQDLMLLGHRCYHIFGVIRMDALRKLPPQGSYVHSDRVLLVQLGMLGPYREIPEYLFISTRHSNQSVVTEPTRMKGRRFRLINQPGTLPALEWWDPRKVCKINFPEWNAMRHYFQSIRRSPLTFREKLRAYGLLRQWIWKYHRRIIKDLVIAADQLLFNLQNAKAIRTQFKQIKEESA
jgi:glycosyltransferase involved in cell wall biosynthesis